jgi:hypothetical protein
VSERTIVVVTGWALLLFTVFVVCNGFMDIRQESRIRELHQQTAYQQRQIDRIELCMRPAVTPYGQQIQTNAGCKP